MALLDIDRKKKPVELSDIPEGAVIIGVSSRSGKVVAVYKPGTYQNIWEFLAEGSKLESLLWMIRGDRQTDGESFKRLWQRRM